MSNDRTRRLAQLRQAFDSGILDADTYQAAAAALEKPVVGVASGAAALGQDNIALGERAIYNTGSVQGDLITGNVYQGPPTDDPVEALRIYRRVLQHSSAALPLRGVHVGASDPAAGQQPLSLAQVYVALDTRSRVAPRSAHKGREEAEASWLGERQAEQPLSALAAAVANPRLVILGDPGSGKSTFVHHLAHVLAAHALEPDAGWLAQHLPDWPPELTGSVPVVVVLRDLARDLSAQDAPATPSLLWGFIQAQLKAQNLEFVARPLRQAIEEGRALFLLDGLDEAAASQRALVRDAIMAFMQRYDQGGVARNRYLVTCRVLSYQPPVRTGEADLRLPAAQFPAFELAPLTEAQIDHFVAAWYQELTRLGSVRAPDVAELVRQLQAAVRRPDLWRLAPNPLLLTIMALVHSHRGRLPDARALLYEETVDMLLWRWEQVKLSGQADEPALRRLLREAQRTDSDLKNVLADLAYAVHGQVEPDDAGEALADIGELRLLKALAALNDDNMHWAQQMVQVMKQRAGLLVERLPEIFTFPHRTFQEYLAGAHLAGQPDLVREAAALADQGALWRDVILLAVGHLVYVRRDLHRPLALVAELCPSHRPETASAWRRVWLAGDALLELGLRRAGDSALGEELLGRVTTRLVALVEGSQLAPRERSAAGVTLARLGDPRRGVGVRVFRPDAPPLPDIVWCYVPPGPFWLGSPDDEPLAEAREQPLHQVDLPYAYWIARYPVTAAQFRAFVAQSGYTPEGRWLESGQDDPDNSPARYVTWRDALAFCRWLTRAAQAQGVLPPDYAVLLPSEAEWEKAARGGLTIPARPALTTFDRPWAQAQAQAQRAAHKPNPLPLRRFVWGQASPTGSHTNWSQTDLQDTCVVGAFRRDATVYGALDLAGNVNEWTRSRWEAYPYVFDDGRENLADKNVVRSIRGGGWYDDETWLRCAYRYWYGPYLDYLDFGFRLVVSRAPAETGKV